MGRHVRQLSCMSARRRSVVSNIRMAKKMERPPATNNVSISHLVQRPSDKAEALSDSVFWQVELSYQ